MKQIMLVGLGGALGAIARWKLSGLTLHHTQDWKFPLATFVVNVAGCLAAGVLAGLAIKHDLMSGDARLFLFTGLLGGFTTFSAFGLETVLLLRRAHYAVAAAYVASSVVAAVLGLWLGLWAVRGGGSN